MDESQLNKILESIGREEWSKSLLGAVDDVEFRNLLTSDEETILSRTKSDVNAIRQYKDRFGDIVTKYHVWEIINAKTKLNPLKKQIKQLTDKVSEGQADLEQLQVLAELSSGAHALVSYSESFQDRADEHKQEAARIFKFYIGSVSALLVTIGLVFFLSLADYGWINSKLSSDLSLNFTIAGYIFKIILVLFFFQIVQFFRKTYNAEKHLQEVYQHRCDVLQSIHAVYISINDPNEKDKLMTAAAMFAYERGETGYITTKEGAGSEGGYIELINRITR